MPFIFVVILPSRVEMLFELAAILTSFVEILSLNTVIVLVFVVIVLVFASTAEMLLELVVILSVLVEMLPEFAVILLSFVLIFSLFTDMPFILV